MGPLSRSNDISVILGNYLFEKLLKKINHIKIRYITLKNRNKLDIKCPKPNNLRVVWNFGFTIFVHQNLVPTSLNKSNKKVPNLFFIPQ